MSVAGWCSAGIGVGGAGVIENVAGVLWVCSCPERCWWIRQIRLEDWRGWIGRPLDARGYAIGPWWGCRQDHPGGWHGVGLPTIEQAQAG